MMNSIYDIRDCLIALYLDDEYEDNARSAEDRATILIDQLLNSNNNDNNNGAYADEY